MVVCQEIKSSLSMLSLAELEKRTWIGMTAATLLINQFGLQPCGICHKNNSEKQRQATTFRQTTHCTDWLQCDWVAKLMELHYTRISLHVAGLVCNSFFYKIYVVFVAGEE